MPPRETHFNRYWIPWFVLTVGVLSTGLVTYHVWGTATAKDEERFHFNAESMRNAITNRLETYVALLRATAGFYGASEEVSLAEFRTFAERMQFDERYPGIQGVGFTRRIPPEELDAVIREMRSQGVEGFRVWPEGPREEYHSIVHLEPLNERNRGALGFDMYSEAVRREAMARARDTGTAAASGRVTLVQEVDEDMQAGFLIYVPVYQGGGIPETLEERRERLLGFAYSPFRAGDLFRGIFGGQERPRLSFSVYDGEEPSPEALLYATSTAAAYQPLRSGERSITLAGRPWTIAFRTTPSFELASGRNFANLTAFLGLLLTAVLFLLSWGQVRARAAAEHIAAELRSSELALHESQERLRAALNASATGTFRWNIEDNSLDFDENLDRLFGLPAGSTVRDLEDFVRRVHPEDREAVREALRRSVSEDADFDERYRILLPDGRVRWLLDRARMVRGEAGVSKYMAGACLDISKLKSAEKKLEESHRRFELIVHSVQLGLWYAPLPFDHLEWNATCKAHFGLPADIHVGIDLFYKCLHPEDREEVRARLEQCIAERCAYDAEFRTIGLDGKLRWVRVLGSVQYDEQQHPLSFSAVTLDISPQKQHEEDLKRFNELLEQRVAERTAQSDARAAQVRAMAAELTQAEQRERRRLALLLHDELQQLVVAAKLRIATLAEEDDPAERITAQREADKLLAQTIQATRSLSLELSPPILYDRGLAAAMEWLARRTQADYGLEVHFEQHGRETQPRNEAIGIFLFQAVRELLFNVVKHAETREARLELRYRDDQQLEITVADSGRGIDMHDREQVERTADHFGLFNVEQRLQLLGGRLELDAAPGKGTRVTLQAPLLPPEPEEAGAPEGRAGEASAAEAGELQAATKPRNGIRVLLVDDHKIVREGLSRLLRNEQDVQLVGEASNGQIALDLVREVRPDVVVMDVSMPIMNGIEATRCIKQEFSGIRVIGLSMHEKEDMAGAMFDAGASVFLSKDGPSADLLAAIRGQERAGV